MSGRELARGWTNCTLGELLVTIRGISYAKEQALAAPAPGYVPILRATNIDRKVHFEDFVFVPRELVSPEQFLRLGDIVIAASSGSKKIVGKAAQLFQEWEGSFGAFCMGIRPTPEIESRFVGYFLQSDEYRHRISDLSAGSNINNLKREHIEWFPFRLAPIQEQRRIAEKIEELLSDLDASVAALERARTNLKRYRAAVLKAAVEGKLTAEWRKANPNVEAADKLLERILAERCKKWEEAQLRKYAAQGKQPPRDWKAKYVQGTKVDPSGLPALPHGWCWATMDQLAYLVRNGLADKPAIQPPGFPILRINAVRPMSTDLEEIRYLDRPRAKVAEYFLSNGDLLFTRYNGSIELLGVGGLVRNCERDVLHPDKLIRVKVVLGSPLPEYLEIVSNVGVSRTHVTSKARTTAGQTGISGTDVKEMPIPLCPLDEQFHVLAEVGARLSVASKAASEIETALARASRVRHAILKRAFEGKLVPQDPNDEPASVLLERIRASRAGKDTRLRKGSRGRDRRVTETGKTGADGKDNGAKRNVFAELSEGFDALKRKRDA